MNGESGREMRHDSVTASKRTGSFSCMYVFYGLLFSRIAEGGSSKSGGFGAQVRKQSWLARGHVRIWGARFLELSDSVG
jgi:hypothetical protein